MVEVRYIEQKNINSSKKRTLRGHIDFNTGEFTVRGKAGRGPTTTPTEYDAEETDEIMKEVASVATAHMLKKWQNKFRKEAKL